MSATIRGADAVAAFLKSLPANLERNVLRGAVKDGAEVVAQQARDNIDIRTPGDSVADSIKVKARRSPAGRVEVAVETSGKNAYRAPWLEHGTDPHLIAADARSADGRLARRTNRKAREQLRETGEYSLVINGQFAGAVVEHPGAAPHAFLRPALDQKAAEAVAAMDAGIRTRLAKRGLAPAPEGDDA